jgi:hypothetical protein
MTTVVTPKAAPQTTSAVAPIQAEAPKVDQAAAPAAVEAPKEEALSPKFAALARQQKAIRRMQQELKAEKEALALEKAQYQTNYVPKDKLKQDPFAVLTEQGLSYDDIVKAAMSQDPQVAAMRKLEMEIQAVKDSQVKAQEEAKASTQKQYEQAVNNIRNEVKMLVDSNASYETIKANDAQEAVVELIKSQFEEDGTLLSVEDASNQVEEYLLEQALKLASLEKVKQRLTPKVEEAAPKAAAPAPKLPSHVKTITNAATQTPSKPLTDKERRERAILAFRNQLS